MLMAHGVLPSLIQILKHFFKGTRWRWPKSRISKVLGNGHLYIGMDTQADCYTHVLTRPDCTLKDYMIHNIAREKEGRTISSRTVVSCLSQRPCVRLMFSRWEATWRRKDPWKARLLKALGESDKWRPTQTGTKELYLKPLENQRWKSERLGPILYV